MTCYHPHFSSLPPPEKNKNKRTNKSDYFAYLNSEQSKPAFIFFLQFSFPSFRVLMKNRIEKHFSGLLKIRTTKTIGTKIMF